MRSNKAGAVLLVGFSLAVTLLAYAQEQASGAPIVPLQAYVDLEKHQQGLDFVTLNFTNIEISAPAKVLSEMTSRNILLDERTTGKITVMTPTKLTPDEA